MLSVLQILKALVEIVGMALLGQGLLFLLAGARRDQNLFYRIISTITAPILKAVRFVTPRFVIDPHIGFVAFFLVLAVWMALRIAIIGGCADDLQQSACASLVEDYVKLCGNGVQEACDLLARNRLLVPPQ